MDRNRRNRHFRGAHIGIGILLSSLALGCAAKKEVRIPAGPTIVHYDPHKCHKELNGSTTCKGPITFDPQEIHVSGPSH